MSGTDPADEATPAASPAQLPAPPGDPYWVEWTEQQLREAGMGEHSEEAARLAGVAAAARDRGASLEEVSEAARASAVAGLAPPRTPLAARVLIPLVVLGLFGYLVYTLLQAAG